MFKEETAELVLGAIVLAVAALFFVFAAGQARGGEGRAGAYELTAQFGRIDGLNVGSDVRISGVKVGVVRNVSLNPDDYRARVTFAIDQGVDVLDEATAKVSSDGLLGGAYVSIEQNGLEPIPAGGEIINTQGSVDLLTLLASAASGSGGNANAEEAE
ncbi:MAG: MCE family protein [Alphaproteobacteria bacterium]|nr:MCE family protein [Alphaproteobacteria bacterium]